MNERTGKLLVFFGSIISLIVTVAFKLIEIFEVVLPKMLELPSALAKIGPSIFIVLGFLIMFISKRKILDLLISVAFAFTYGLSYALSSWMSDPYVITENGFSVENISTIWSFVIMIPYALWFIKLIKTTAIGAIFVLVSIPISIFVPSIITSIAPPASPLYFLLITLETVGICALRATAAYIDMQKQNLSKT